MYMPRYSKSLYDCSLTECIEETLQRYIEAVRAGHQSDINKQKRNLSKKIYDFLNEYPRSFIDLNFIYLIAGIRNNEKNLIDGIFESVICKLDADTENSNDDFTFHQSIVALIQYYAYKTDLDSENQPRALKDKKTARQWVINEIKDLIHKNPTEVLDFKTIETSCVDECQIISKNKLYAILTGAISREVHFLRSANRQLSSLIDKTDPPANKTNLESNPSKRLKTKTI